MANSATEKFTIELNDAEVWDLIHMIRQKLFDAIPHCAMHDGWQTLMYNYQRIYDNLEFFSGLIGRSYMYTSFRKEWEADYMKYLTEDKA